MIVSGTYLKETMNAHGSVYGTSYTSVILVQLYGECLILLLTSLERWRSCALDRVRIVVRGNARGNYTLCADLLTFDEPFKITVKY